MLDWKLGFLAMPRSLRDPTHPYHPMQRGEKVCRLYALEDLIYLARWKDEGAVLRGQCVVGVRFLAKRWNRSKTWASRILRELEDDGFLRRMRQAGHRQPDVIEVVGYEDLFIRSRAALAQLSWDAADGVPTGAFGPARDTPTAQRRDKEKAFATGKVEVRLVGVSHTKSCHRCRDVFVSEDQDVCGTCRKREEARTWSGPGTAAGRRSS